MVLGIQWPLQLTRTVTNTTSRLRHPSPRLRVEPLTQASTCCTVWSMTYVSRAHSVVEQVEGARAPAW
jgi:hypothetical protein